MTPQKTTSLPMDDGSKSAHFSKMVALLQNQDAVEGRMCRMKVNADRASVAKSSQKSQREHRRQNYTSDLNCSVEVYVRMAHRRYSDRAFWDANKDCHYHHESRQIAVSGTF